LLDLIGVYAPDFEIDFLKTTVWLHPQGLDNKARLILKMMLKYNKKKEENIDLETPREIIVYFGGESNLQVKDLYDEHAKLEQGYLTSIGSKFVVNEKEIESSNILSEPVVITNIPPKCEERETYTMANKKYIQIKMKITPFKNDRTGILMISMILEGKIIEKESILKRLIGISRFAWRFQYRLWGHKELTPSFSESAINQCQEAQVYVIIPRKFFTSKGHISPISGGDDMHVINESDIYLFTESLVGEKKEKDSKWMEKGSCAISWNFARNILSLSREICIEHHEAFPRITTVFFLFSFWSALVIGMIMISYKGVISSGDLIFPGLVFLLTSVLVYFLINLKNYSFYEAGLPSRSRTLQSICSILATCVVASATLLPILVQELTRYWDTVLYVLFGVSLLAFAYLSLKNEMKVESRSVDENRKKSGPIMTVLLFMAVIFLVSLLFSWKYLGDDTFLSRVFAFWTFNNFASLLSRYPARK
jgi:hypothetical protein